MTFAPVHSDAPKPKLPLRYSLLMGGTVPLIYWPAVEIARQLTLIEFDLFSKIKPKGLFINFEFLFKFYLI